MFVRAGFALLLSVLLWAGPVTAQNSITTGKIHFAQVAALEGPAAALGAGMRRGILAAFDEVNQKGGVGGRQIMLDSMDDGYEPDRSVTEVRKVIENKDYIALIGPVGTPTSKATQPIATQADMPFIGPFTGAGFLRDPELENVINVRASYEKETEAWIRYLVDDLGLSKIAILYQDDGFGRVGLAGVQKALEARGISLLAESTYTRNTVAVKSALLSFRGLKPDAIVMVGTYKPLAKFIKLSQRLKIDPIFITISFVGSKAFSNELGPDGEGVIISQVVPFPWDKSLPIVADYQLAMKAVDETAEFGFVSLEGYIVGRLAIEILQQAGENVTRASYLNAMKHLGTIDLGGLSLTFGPHDNQGSDDVFLTRILSDGSFEAM